MSEYTFLYKQLRRFTKLIKNIYEKLKQRFVMLMI